MSTDEKDRRRQRIALVVFVIVLVGLGTAIVLASLGRGSGQDQSAAPAPAPEPAVSSGPVPVEHVMLMAVNTPGDEFTPPVGTDVEMASLAAQGSTGLIDVQGDAVGLYGGSMKLSSCERAQLADFLDSHPAKAAAWAEVQGIETTAIRSFLAGLTPLVLRADTLVTNHGYFDGQATTFASVLQAGTAVLVNDVGLPVVRCFCGNPLTAAPDLVADPVYDGPAWEGWNPFNTVRVKASTRVIDGFEVVDPDTDSLFTRPAGTAGGQDASTGQPAPAGLEGTPVQPATAAPAVPGPGATTPAQTSGGPAASAAAAPAPTPGSTDRPAGEPAVLFEVTSIAGVSSGPPRPTAFTLPTSAYLTSIGTYHYLNKGSGPGTIALKASDGTMYGPWQATGAEGQGGVKDAYWTVTPNVVVPAGRYTVVDSNPGTWSWAFDTRQRGITSVQGIALLTGGEEGAGASLPSASAAVDVTDCSAYPQDSMMWTLCMHDPGNG